MLNRAAQHWHPIQDLLTQLGIRMKEIWVDIVEEIAKAVDSGSIESTLTNDLTDIATGSKSAGDAFTDMANQIVRAIEQMIIKIMIVEPLMRSLKSAFSGGFNLSGFGFNPIAGATGSAQGNVSAGGKVFRSRKAASPIARPSRRWRCSARRARKRSCR